MRISIYSLSCLVLAVAGACGSSPQEIEFFEKRVRPVLADHCYKCHGSEKQKAELRLDSRAGVLKGTDVGPVVVVGKPEESSLIKSIRHEGDTKMPEKEGKLGDEQIQALTEWVKMGLPWPEHAAPSKPSVIEEAAKNHWSFQPVRKPVVPAVVDAEKWAKTDLDRFILAKLEAAGLQPSPRADARTLIRRMTFDLIGLPPTAAEVEAFVGDSIRRGGRGESGGSEAEAAAPGTSGGRQLDEAIRKVIDRLLASPHYGERWGRHWLDVARYADTKGYVFQEERRFGFAYTYRDWVIKAFNDDLPYDQFLIQQIAGDHVAAAGDTRPLAALGFLTLGRRFPQQSAGHHRRSHRCRDARHDGADRLVRALSRSQVRSRSRRRITTRSTASSPRRSSRRNCRCCRRTADPENDAEYRAERAKLRGRRDALHWREVPGLRLGATVLTRVPVVLPPLPRESLREADHREPIATKRANSRTRSTRSTPVRFAPPRAMALVDGPLR